MPLASIDVFNPKIGYDKGMGFNPNWNYQSPVAAGANYQTARPRFGAWSGREVGDAGYSFALNFVDRPIAQVNYIRTWYAQFQRGFFTLVDYDNFKREHVGRFTAPPKVTPAANMRYNISVPFEEIPGCPMRNYPANWQEWSHELAVADDWLNPIVNTSSIYAGAWVLQQTPQAIAQGESTSKPISYELFNVTPSLGDFAQMEYSGWGFRMTLRLSSGGLGNCEMYLDGVPLLASINLVNGATTAGSSTIVPFCTTDGVSELTVQVNNLPLGRHRVKIQSLGVGSLLFPSMQVIH